MTVPVHENGVPGPDQCLNHDLVRRGGAVGDEKGPLRTKGPCRLILCLLQRTVGLQQGVQASLCGRGFREKDVGAIELAHILDPVGFVDGIPSGDGQSVKHARGLAAVFFQGREKGGFEAILNPLKNGKVNVQIVALIVEDSLKDTGRLQGNLFRRYFGDQILIQLGSKLVDGLAEGGLPIHGFAVPVLVFPAHVMPQGLQRRGGFDFEPVP